MSFEYFQLVQDKMPWFFTGVFAVFGAIVGSFLNVCIFRIPRGRSVISPPSQCACGAAIPWYRNIPILAWLVLRGKAPCCGQSFSFRYPLVEALTAGLFALCWALLPWQQAVPGVVFMALLVVLAFIDLDTMMLPDGLNVGLAMAGLAFSIALPALHGETHHSLWLVNAIRSLCIAGTGMLVGAGLVYWFRLLSSLVLGRESMGEGDIILLGGIGAFCGWQGTIFAMFGGAVIGTMIIIPFLVARKLIGKKMTGLERNLMAAHASYEGDEFAEDIASPSFGIAVPFGPWLAIGGAIWYLFLRIPFSHYIEHFKSVILTN
ncbi:MAG: prepilin peptidase [Puniceicoccales bacterium]|nr:prepilin peptidase [Puniceicoccales bacterium]